MFEKIKKWNRERIENIRQKKIIAYINEAISNATPKLANELKEVRSCFLSGKLYFIPHKWIEEYNSDKVTVEYDSSKDLHYAYWHGKKMYWKRGISVDEIRENVNRLMIEQDSRSPHKYTVDEHNGNGVVADIGAAEGCFALTIIENAEHIYLFECDSDWIEALKATFAPWKDKVTIVSKFVGNENDEKCVTLDKFFADKKLDSIKADIEGAEMDMLLGAENVMMDKVKSINICVYHNYDDEEKITDYLVGKNFACEINPGLMWIYGHNKPFEQQFVHGVLHATKN